MSRRNAYFVLLVAPAAILSWAPAAAVVAAAFRNEQYSHILLILPVSVALLYAERQEVFQNVRYCLPAGAILMLLAGAFSWVVRNPQLLSQNNAICVRMALFIGWLVTAFALCYGMSAFLAATFPLLFLFFMVPIPDSVLERIVGLLQSGSTEMTFLMLKAARVPVLRQGFVLALPGVDIEVAKECSGIRSSLMLLIVGLVLGQLFLQTTWRKVVLALFLVPLAIAKNAIRIFTLSTLAVYVDPSYLSGDLHHSGGIVFFAVALGALMLVIWLLRRTETGANPNEPVLVRGNT